MRQRPAQTGRILYVMKYRVLAAFSGALQFAAVATAAAQSPAKDTLRLSIEEAVNTGLKMADEVRLSAAQADIADAQFDASRGAMLPSLRLTSSFGRTYFSARSLALNPVFNQTNAYTFVLNFSQPLFQGGKLFNATRSSYNLAHASALDAQEQRALFSVLVQRAYLNALLAERVVELQETNLALASSRLTQVQQFQAAGRASNYDALRAKVERSNIEPLTIQARNDRELAQLEVKRLLNIPLDKPLALTSVIDPNAAQILVASYLDSTDASQRPMLKSAQLTARARHLAIQSAAGDLFPTVSVFFNGGFGAFPAAGTGIPTQRGFLATSNCADTTSTRPCQNNGWFKDASMGIQMSWNLFDGLRNKNAIEIAKAQVRSADLTLRQQTEQVAVEVARARAELRRAKAVFDGRRETASEANEAFSLANLRFTRGLSTQLEVSDAQVALLTAQGNEARATYDLYLATAEMARALGRPIPLPATSAPARRTSSK
jgi:outer membrane protein TolC